MLTLRPMRPTDLALALDWAAQEGWNPGIHDAIAFYATDPEGFLLAELADEPIGCISAVRYSSQFGFIGLYIVRPQWRGQGYGLRLWRTAWEQLRGRLDPNASIGLDGVLEREATYCKAGFTPVYRHVRHRCDPQGLAHLKRASFESQSVPGAIPGCIVPGSIVPGRIVPLIPPHPQIPLEHIVQYDAELFPAARPQFLEPWLGHATAAYGVVVDQQLRGYGVLRPCREGFKVGPLMADSPAIALAILDALIPAAGPQPVFLDSPDCQPALAELVQRYQLQPVFTCVRMYWGLQPSGALSSGALSNRAGDRIRDRVFGVTSLELG